MAYRELPRKSVYQVKRGREDDIDRDKDKQAGLIIVYPDAEKARAAHHCINDVEHHDGDGRSDQTF
jgi:hypothetical protein